MFSPGNRAWHRNEIIVARERLRAFIFNHSYLSYHRLGSGQTIAMATIISGNLYSLLIFVSLLQSIRVLVFGLL